MHRQVMHVYGMLVALGPMGRVFAAVDIGSNTVHMLVAEVEKGRLRRIRNESEWLGLGEAVTRDAKLPVDAIGDLIAALSRFKLLAASEKASSLYVFATEAIRAASNGPDAIRLIERSTKLKVEIISGRREAELGLNGSLIDTDPPKPFALAEVGGGSAQLARCDETGVHEEFSLPLGTGRLTAKFGLVLPCPVEMYVHVKEFVDLELREHCRFDPVIALVASGGVARGMVRALHPDGETTVRREELEYLIWATRRLGVEKTSARFGVKARRAGTLLLGSTLFAAIMDRLGVNEMSVSECGVREGAIFEMATGRLRGSKVA